MTDEQMSDIYALARESFFGGQKSIQVQAYPFRMTPSNLAKHRNNPHIAFWKMLKQGNDQFELSHLEPTVDVCEKRYVFGASKQSEQDQFLPAAKCPPYSVPEEIALVLSKKQQKDEMLVAELVSRGMPVAPQNLGIDGGMHSLFAAKVSNGSTGISDSKSSVLSATMSVASVPPGVNQPRSKQTVPFGADTFSSFAEDGGFRSGNSPSAPGASVGIFGRLARQMGIVDAPAADKSAKIDSAKKGYRPAEK